MGSFSPPTLKIGQRAKTHCWVPLVGCRVHSDGASFLRWAKKKPLKPLLEVKDFFEEAESSVLVVWCLILYPFLPLALLCFCSSGGRSRRQSWIPTPGVT